MSPTRTTPYPSATLNLRPVRRTLVAVAVSGLALTLSIPAASAAPAAIGLGTATSFSVLAGAGITNIGATTIGGDIGTFATTSETGLGTVTLGGVDHAGDAVTQQAKTDLTTAYNQAAGSGPPTSVATELGGTTLTPGVYNGATLQITGTLTLDTQGDPNAVFIFQTASTLITASASSVVILGSSTACNVFWQVSSSATLGTTSNLVGTVMASTSITADNGATIQGRLLAQSGAVTLDQNTITTPICATAPASTTTTPLSTTTVTQATTAALSSSPTSSVLRSGGAGGGNTTGTPTTTSDGSTTGADSPPFLASTGVSGGHLAAIAGTLIATGTALTIRSGRLARRDHQ